MGKLVKALGVGIGLAAEAIHQRNQSRARSAAAANESCNPDERGQPASSSTASVSSSQQQQYHHDQQRHQQQQYQQYDRGGQPSDDAPPPAYSEVVQDVDYQHGGHGYGDLPPPPAAGPSQPSPGFVDYNDEKKGRHDHPENDEKSRSRSKSTEAGGGGRGYPPNDQYYYDPEEKEEDYDNADEFGQDSAIWELDEMAQRVVRDPSSSSSSSSPTTTEEEEDTQTEEAKLKKREKMVREIVSMASPPPISSSSSSSSSSQYLPLPYPIIIPQRRPRNKDRGFVRAYAPVLENYGIGQDLFIRFLTDWVTASKSDKWIDVVYISASALGMVPDLASQIVGTVVQVAAGAAREAQSRSRRNGFLDMMNEMLFMPRGLFAMVMSFKEEVSSSSAGGGGPLGRLAGSLGRNLVSTERLDINQTAAKYSSSLGGGGQGQGQGAGGGSAFGETMRRGMQNLRLQSGTTYGQIELPQAAELVFPDLDRTVEEAVVATSSSSSSGKGKETEGGSSSKKNNFKDKLKGAGEFVQDYLDRKAQAEYAAENQGSALAVPDHGRKGFASRYSDPNHPANSGSLVALLTGGVVNPDAMRGSRGGGDGGFRGGRRGERRMERRSRGGFEPFGVNVMDAAARGGGGGYYEGDQQQGGGRMRERRERGGRRGGGRGERQGMVKKLLQQDVLYLIVVNLPSEKQLQDSVAYLETAMGGAGAAGGAQQSSDPSWSY